MNLRVFKISGKFQQSGMWSNRQSDFIGYFVKKEGTDVIEGYMEEQYPTPYERIRYIKGLYIEDKKQIAFFKMCNTRGLQPLAYAFPNLEKQGFWSGIHILIGFFPEGNYEGKATVRLEEILDEEEKNKLSLETFRIFEDKTSHAWGMRQDILARTDNLKLFLKENFNFHPRY